MVAMWVWAGSESFSQCNCISVHFLFMGRLFSGVSSESTNSFLLWEIGPGKNSPYKVGGETIDKNTLKIVLKGYGYCWENRGLG